MDKRSVNQEVAVVIASHGRPKILGETLEAVMNNTVVPGEVIVVVSREEDFPKSFSSRGVRFFSGPQSLTRQRNIGVEKVSQNTRYIAFLDDDLIIGSSYIKNIVEAFESSPDTILIQGRILQNGNIDVDSAKGLIARAQADRDRRRDYLASTSATWGGVYGANMCFRKSFFDHHRFDERLTGYALMEDVDIGTLARRAGDVGYHFGAICVHLRFPGGRVSQKRIGFSEVMNPFYLARKGTVPMRIALLRHVIRTPASNLAKVILSLGRRETERFSGNLIALQSILFGRIDPERVDSI